MHIRVQEPDVHVCIYVCRGWMCRCAYTCAKAGRAHVHICVPGSDMHVRIYMCRGWTCTWAYMCVGVIYNPGNGGFVEPLTEKSH